MTDFIIDGVCFALASHFGGCLIYTDPIPQEFKKPCFFVSIKSQKEIPRIGGRIIFRYNVLIKYYPGDSMPTTECQAVTDQLYSVLQEINAGGQVVRRLSCSSSLSGDVLNFNALYDVFLEKEEEQPQVMGICNYLWLGKNQ